MKFLNVLFSLALIYLSSSHAISQTPGCIDLLAFNYDSLA
ncbi:MAG: hypothetical protein ACI80P_001274, partial [Flavobacteriales bacterium]